MMDYEWLCGTFTVAYFLGSIPFGLLLTKLFGLGDIRKIGSGNIGATNVMRTGHKALGIATLLLDAGKGTAAIFLTRYLYSDESALLAGFFVVIGHVFPVWLHFKGGKGVATTLGVLFGLQWMIGAVACAIWVMTFLYARISSVSSMLSIALSSIGAYLIAGEGESALCLALATLIMCTHRTNIQRLMDGTEHHFKPKES